MSYICNSCGKAQEAGSKPYKVVVETRYATYPNFGEGREIVKEANLCGKCYTKWMKDHPVRIEEIVEVSFERMPEPYKGFYAKVKRL